MLRPFSSLRALKGALALALTLGSIGSAGAQAIRNTATLSFSDASGPREIDSNTVELARLRRPSDISFRRLPAGTVVDSSQFICEPENDRLVRLQPVTTDELMRAEPLASYDINEAALVVLEAEAENRDPFRIETAMLIGQAGDRTNRIFLAETGPNTGWFVGVVPPQPRNDPRLAACSVTNGKSRRYRVSYEGSESSEASFDELLIDIDSEVFDAVTGDTVDGVTVELLDANTDRPAQVFGDDGVSAYPSSVVTGSAITDASGHEYRFAKGGFRYPLVRPGRYRFKITPPEAYHGFSRRQPSEIASLSDPYGRSFDVEQGSYGEPFELTEASPVSFDIPIDGKVLAAQLGARLMVTKTASALDASAGDFISYSVRVDNAGGGPSQPVQILDTLPHGLRYHKGTTKGAPEPELGPAGTTLRFTLPSVLPGQPRAFTYLVFVTPEARAGEAVNRAQASDGLSSSPEAIASVQIRPLPFSDALVLIGRVTEGGCGDPLRGRKGVAGVRVVLEDGSFTLTDRDGLYHFEGVRPGTHVAQIDTATLPAGYAPVTCDSDTRSARSGISRFVEGQGGSLQRADFQLRRDPAAAAAAAAAVQAPAADDALAAGNRDDWLARAVPGKIDWLFPATDHNPRAPALRAVVQHLPGQRVALTINGKPVEPIAYDGSEDDAARGVAISRWSGIPLGDRDNQLEARILDAQGAEVARITRMVHYANVAARAEAVPGRSTLVADGVTRPLIAVRVTDRDGKPVRAGTPVPFRVEAPYVAAQEVAAQQGRQLAGMERTATAARVTGDDGIALIALQPTSQTGAVRLAIEFSEEGRTRTSTLDAWLSAPARDWMVVGFGRGTIGYETLRKKTQPIRTRDVVADGQIALFAKGRIKGSWLLTMAYDSDKQYDRERGLLGTIDPDRYYTVYGDGSAQGYDAASRSKLYLRLERRAFYALLGDFETGFTDTKLARFSRTLSGAKAEYAANGVQAAAFAARADERYARDEIQGNGLSGPYRLGARDIVPNSDKLRLETRDRYRSEKILESRPLTRHIDYDIDAIAGTIRFREPVLSRDPGGNPVFIVADYETYGPSREIVAGARASVGIAANRVRVGATVLRDQTAGDATVAALDMRARVTATTELRAEGATGGRGGIDAGRAVSAEVEHHSGNVDVLAYANRQDSGFGTGQQNAGEVGMAKIGLDGRVRIGSRVSATGSGWHQQDLSSDATRIAADARVELRRDRGTVSFGTQIASDRGTDGTQRDSRLLTLGATQRVLNDKIELSGQVQLPLGKAESVDFPARQQIGASWRVTDDVRLVGGYEIARGETFTARAARIGFDVAPWAGAKLLSTINQQAIGENGRRTFAQYGFSQTLPVSQRWTIDATLDASGTISGDVPEGGVVSPFHPLATGAVLGQDSRDGDFVAVTAGATYRGPRWTWSGRAEYRNSDESRRLGFTSSLLRALGEGSTLASSLDAYRIVDREGRAVSHASADLALALRPLDSRWAVLERFQLRHEHADAGVSSNNALAVPAFTGGIQATLRAINSLAVSYRTGEEGGAHGFEASLYQGVKYVRGRYSDETVDGVVDMAGIEVRKDLRANLDIGANASFRHSWSDGGFQFAAGPSLGFSPGGGAWVSAGYNVSGYRDRDFEQERYTREGAYLTLRMRLDQSLLGRAAGLVRGNR